MKPYVLFPPARRDLAWFQRYYQRAFPEGAKAASEHYLTALRTLREYPEIGRAAGVDDVRRLLVNRTPFVILYRVRERIEILRIRDARSGSGGVTGR